MLNINNKLIIFLAFFIVFLSLIIIIVKKNKSFKTRKKLVDNSNFIKENGIVIKKIMENNLVFRKTYLIKVGFTILLFIIGVIMAFLFKKYHLFLFFGVGLIIISFIVIMIIYYEYVKDFKNNIIRKIIETYNPHLFYEPENGFNISEYYLCRFNEKCDIFSSEDLIYDEENGFMYSDVLVKSEYEDSDGNTHTRVEYRGSLAKMDIRDCECEIYLGSVRRNPFSRNNYQSIKFENDEFNKLFSAYTNDELKSYKILTPDIMEEFVHLKKNTYGDIDIRIIYGELYVRFSSGNGFVPSLFSKTRETNSIISSIAVLDEVINTMNNVKTLIEKKMF